MNTKRLRQALKRWALAFLAAALLFPFAAGKPAVAADDVPDNEPPPAAADALEQSTLLGEVIFAYEFDEVRQFLGRSNVVVGHPHERGSYAADRVVLGERGLYLRWGLTSMFFPNHAFTLIELNDQNVGSLIERFADEALWRRSWHQHASGLLNFSYEVAGDTYGVAASDVVVTPDFLVVAANGGQTLRIIKYEVVDRIEIVD